MLINFITIKKRGRFNISLIKFICFIMFKLDVCAFNFCVEKRLNKLKIFCINLDKIERKNNNSFAFVSFKRVNKFCGKLRALKLSEITAQVLRPEFFKRFSKENKSEKWTTQKRNCAAFESILCKQLRIHRGPWCGKCPHATRIVPIRIKQFQQIYNCL